MTEREQRRKHREKRGKKIQGQFYRRLARVFGVLLLVFVLLNVIKRDQEFSDEENRMLASRPKLTWESIKSGDFMTDFETYVSDQFFARNQWISLKLNEDRILGKKESNGVYLGKKGYLIEKPDTPDWESVERNMAAISDFAERHSKISTYTCFVPNAYYILEDRLPAQAPVRDQAADLVKIREMEGSSVKDIDVTATLQDHAGEDIYYKTDHHWTSLGASYAFEDVAQAMGLKNVETDYTVHTVASDFQGTLASKSGYHGSEDLVQVYQPKNQEVEYVVTYVEEGEKSTSIYDSKCLEEKDKYTVFFGGNHARIDIGTTQPERKNLLIFKDSYANCFVQFLLPYYQNIIIVDPRYYYENVDSLVESYGITDILFLYNVNTFVTDNSIADVLAAEAESQEETAAEDTEESQEATTSQEKTTSEEETAEAAQE